MRIMRIKAIIIFYSFLFLALKIQAQSNYMIGYSNVSIKPDNSVFSVALADYADPRDGRFRIAWKYIGENKEITALTGLGDKICATKNNELLVKNPGDDVLQRKVIGRMA
jgi:hypothetical protein